MAAIHGDQKRTKTSATGPPGNREAASSRASAPGAVGMRASGSTPSGFRIDWRSMRSVVALPNHSVTAPESGYPEPPCPGIDRPASTFSSVPVTCEDSSESRNTTDQAESSGVCCLPSGWRLPASAIHARSWPSPA